MKDCWGLLGPSDHWLPTMHNKNKEIASWQDICLRHLLHQQMAGKPDAA